MMEKYRTFYSIEAENIHIEANYTEVKDEKLPIAFKPNAKPVISLKISYPIYADPNDKSTLKKHTICHQIDVSVLKELVNQ